MGKYGPIIFPHVHLIGSINLHKIKINRFSVGVWVLIFIMAIMGLTFVAAFDAKFFSEDVVGFMKEVEVSFLGYEGGSNRYNIQWNDISDFMYNSLWGIPQGLIGPTLLEAISKPIQFPVFLEGVVYLYILFNLNIIERATIKEKFLKIMIFNLMLNNYC